MEIGALCAAMGVNQAMTEVLIELPSEVAEAVAQKAAELGTTSNRLLSDLVENAVTEMGEHADNEDWKFR